MIGQALTVLAISIQSGGKVLYGTYLSGVSTPLFLFVSFCLTALVFLFVARAKFPPRGAWLITLANIWTATGFVGMFFALRHLPPAAFAAVEIGTALVTAVALNSFPSKAVPDRSRLLGCGGIVAGCGLLCWAELSATAEDTTIMVWLAFATCVAVGATSALMAETCKTLNTRGWTCSSILAHRFYLTIAIAAAWLAFDPALAGVPGAESVGMIAVVGAITVMLPALLLQFALKRIDSVVLMMCMAAQPVISFLLAVPSPAYDWNWLTLAGVVVVSASLLADIGVRSRSSLGR